MNREEREALRFLISEERKRRQPKALIARLGPFINPDPTPRPEHTVLGIPRFMGGKIRRVR